MGPNVGPQGPETERDGQTAAEVAELRQGSTYIDLAEPRPTEFTATGEMAAENGQLLVAKQAVAYELWDRLVKR